MLKIKQAVGQRAGKDTERGIVGKKRGELVKKTLQSIGEFLICATLLFINNS